MPVGKTILNQDKKKPRAKCRGCYYQFLCYPKATLLNSITLTSPDSFK